MAFAGIFQPFARLRWIRFGLLMRDRKFSRRLSVPQTTALALAVRLRLRVTRSEITIHELGRHCHHDQSKNPAHHTTGSKLAPRRAVLKFNLDAIHRAVMKTDRVSPDDISGCSLSSLTPSAVLARSFVLTFVVRCASCVYASSCSSGYGSGSTADQLRSGALKDVHMLRPSVDATNAPRW